MQASTKTETGKHNSTEDRKAVRKDDLLRRDASQILAPFRAPKQLLEYLLPVRSQRRKLARHCHRIVARYLDTMDSLVIIYLLQRFRNALQPEQEPSVRLVGVVWRETGIDKPRLGVDLRLIPTAARGHLQRHALVVVIGMRQPVVTRCCMREVDDSHVDLAALASAVGPRGDGPDE